MGVHALLRVSFAAALVASLLFLPKSEASAAPIETVGGTAVGGAAAIIPGSDCD